MRRLSLALALATVLLAASPMAYAQTITNDPSAQASPFNPTAPFATAQCNDGWFSFSQTRDGTCSGHGGVMLWVTEPGTADALATSRTADRATDIANYAAGIQTQLSWSSGSGSPFIPYAGNGQGPTVCNDNMVSHSAGQGTCSHHGGEAP